MGNHLVGLSGSKDPLWEPESLGTDAIERIQAAGLRRQTGLRRGSGLKRKQARYRPCSVEPPTSLPGTLELGWAGEKVTVTSAGQARMRARAEAGGEGAARTLNHSADWISEKPLPSPLPASQGCSIKAALSVAGDKSPGTG